MSGRLSFIETQFPVSKISKESYKERKSSQGQTITGLGKWWGRKPLILVRAVILGCLIPASDNPARDMEIFLKILSMDREGLLQRKDKRFTDDFLYKTITEHAKLRAKYAKWFDESSDKRDFLPEAPMEELEEAVFQTLGYDQKLTVCMRPEQLENLESGSWMAINEHLGTSAWNLRELISQLSRQNFGHTVTVGDCFCGGGSIPFEAARIGCGVYASDLNPIAGLLTWSALNLCGASKQEMDAIREFQQSVYEAVDREICDLGIEQNEKGDRALSYLYCLEADCPECGYRVPLLPTLAVGIRAGRAIAVLRENGQRFDIDIQSGVSAEELRLAQAGGTVRRQALICPHCGKSTPISSLRHDGIDEKGDPVYGLRMWEKDEFEPRADDLYQERLYAIRYEHITILNSGRTVSTRYYRAPETKDLQNEETVKSIVRANFHSWQEQGLIPSMKIESGAETERLYKERGWGYWHQLFSARQLYLLSRFAKHIKEAASPIHKAAGILGLNKCADFNSKLCRWNPNCDKTEQTFYNQALNTLMNWGARSLTMVSTLWFRMSECGAIPDGADIRLLDARDVQRICDIWITDPPYADAVNYHELSELFLAWDKRLLHEAFPDWYMDSKRILAVRGDRYFSQTMIEIYTNLANHMPAHGMQVVMFTHSDPAIWAQLAIIMWKSGLKVTAAWNVATETDASGLKNGNYVKGTVLMILRKQTGTSMAFLDEINADIRNEVRRQIESMKTLDDKEEPNFSDSDNVLAAYAASLKVLTSYHSIEDLDLDFELSQAIANPSQSKVVAIIENAKRIAYDCVIPLSFEGYIWKELTNAEKFYIKGLESEKHGNDQISTYQEYARGFSIGGYSQLMASERANRARLKTPFEMAGRTLGDVPDFEHSLTRTIFMGIYTGIRRNKEPSEALKYIKNEVADYWGKRSRIREILRFLVDTKDISNMRPHWKESAEMAELLLALVSHDSI